MKPLIKAFREAGWWAAHLSPASHTGYPDIDACRDWYYCKIECKDISDIKLAAKIATVMTKWQIPWMTKYLMKNGGNLFIVLYSDFANIFYVRKIETHSEAMLLADITIGCLIQKCESRVEPREVVRLIKSMVTKP